LAYRAVLTPTGHWVRDAVLRPAAATARTVLIALGLRRSRPARSTPEPRRSTMDSRVPGPEADDDAASEEERLFRDSFDRPRA
jgi:hypothetical protein